MFSKKKRETAKLLLLHDQSYCIVSGATRKEWEDEVVFPVGCALPFGTAVIDDRSGRLYHAMRDYYAQFDIQTARYDFSSLFMNTGTIRSHISIQPMMLPNSQRSLQNNASCC